MTEELLKIRKDLSKKLKKERFEHTIGVMYTAASLAMCYGSDIQKALTAGLLASLMMKKLGYPRISVTVPSIVIMVPGLYLYRAVYNMGEMSLTLSAPWRLSCPP